MTAVRDVLRAAVRAEELLPLHERRPSPIVVAGCMLRDLGDLKALEEAREIVKLLLAVVSEERGHMPPRLVLLREATPKVSIKEEHPEQDWEGWVE